jgi:hypothetical protein
MMHPMHKFTIGFGGTKASLFNKARVALEQASPRGTINGNAERGRMLIPGLVPASDEMLVVDYVVGPGVIDFIIRNPLPAFIADTMRSNVEAMVPKGPYVQDGPMIPSSIPIEKIPDLSKTYGKKVNQETRQLAVIDDDKPMLSKKTMIALAITTAIGFGVYFWPSMSVE